LRAAAVGKVSVCDAGCQWASNNFSAFATGNT